MGEGERNFTKFVMSNRERKRNRTVVERIVSECRRELGGGGLDEYIIKKWWLK